MRFALICTLIGICLLGACRFEQDDMFVPQTLASYLLVEQTDGRHLIRYGDSTLTLCWEEQLGLDSEDLGGLDIYESELWLGDASLPGLRKLAPAEGITEASFNLQNLIPNELSVGREVILLCDTLNSQLGFWHKSRESLVRIPLATAPSQPLYIAGQFYVIRQDTLDVFHETTYARLAKIPFSDTLTNLQFGQRRSVTVYTSENDSVKRAELDLYSHSLLTSFRALPIKKEIRSPYRQSYYGKERLNSILLRNNGQVEGFQDVEDLDFDFFEQTYFLLGQDSLWVANREKEIFVKAALDQAKVITTAYYQGTLADSK